MAAAISDFIPQRSNKKLKRNKTLTLKLETTPDILTHLSKDKKDTQTFIGFCLDDKEVLLESAKNKLTKKNLDYIIANTTDNIGKNIRSFHILSKNNTPKYHENLNLTETSHQLLQLIPKQHIS